MTDKPLTEDSLNRAIHKSISNANSYIEDSPTVIEVVQSAKRTLRQSQFVELNMILCWLSANSEERVYMECVKRFEAVISKIDACLQIDDGV